VRRLGAHYTGARVAISSMTGFARASGGDDSVSWAWEVRSVNARGLDIRTKLPPGFEAFEVAVRQAVGARFKRGAVSASLTTTRTAAQARLRINRELLDEVVRLHKDLAGIVDPAPPALAGLLAVRGVVESVEEEETEDMRAAREAAMRAALDEALAGLAAMRAAEGARLAAVLAEQLDGIARLAAMAQALAALQPEAVHERLRAQLKELLKAEPAFSEERLHQEAALLVAKGDVREELDRLVAHVAAARELLGSAEPVGRSLDFLCQELNREANTLCSKSSDVELTRVGLALKAAIEQMREQVQNIE
jgi:uncharacterized protein (TIGR00255 family)